MTEELHATSSSLLKKSQQQLTFSAKGSAWKITRQSIKTFDRHTYWLTMLHSPPCSALRELANESKQSPETKPPQV